MSRNSPLDFTQRLYERIPANYRVYDAERGQPLLALMRTIAGPVSALRRDLDALWDNFFIETCDDWVVAYLGALVGTNALVHPVGRSNRLDVASTIDWRRRKGTPAMLAELATAVTEWPADLGEFFTMLGWSENMNHVRAARTLTADLRDPYALGLLGTARDPFAHAADFRTSAPLDQARAVRGALTSRLSWGTPGRYTIKNAGFFARRLQTFANLGATPSGARPGVPAPANRRCWRFDPLDRDVPLFAGVTHAPIARSAFAHDPAAFATDVVVRQLGIPLARAAGTPLRSSSHAAFRFGGAGAGLRLHPSAGLRLMNGAPFARGSVDFVIAAQSMPAGTALGTLHTRTGAYAQGAATTGAGSLALTVSLASGATRARFPGAVLAVRAAQSGALRDADGLYAYLPARAFDAGTPVTYYVADDGSTYTSASLGPADLARPSEGALYPVRATLPSVTPITGAPPLRRTAGALVVADPSRCAGSGAFIAVGVLSGTFQPAAGLATAASGSAFPGFPSGTWAPFADRASIASLNGTLPDSGLLAVQITPLGGDALPPLELVVALRDGSALLVYLPGAPANTPAMTLLVADDGATYFAPADTAALQTQGATLTGLALARAGAGQVLPIAGRWPLQQRTPVAVDLARSALIRDGELGIDPELGRFAFAENDPALAGGALSVDYREGFSDRVGALNFDRQFDPKAVATRFVASGGDATSQFTTVFAGAPVHTSVVDALAHAKDGDVIEIADSATYVSAVPALLANPAVKTLTLRAAQNRRPTLAFYASDGTPAPASIRVTVPMERLELSGLLIGGAPVRIDATVAAVLVTACSLDPASDRGGGMLIVSDDDRNANADYVLCRCVCGGVRAGLGVGRFTLADSILDGRAGTAFDSLPFALSPPLSPLSPPGPHAVSPLTGARLLQLERVTVLGAVHCEILSASDTLLRDVAVADDRQRGCIRYSRYQRGSALPRRYRCVPSESQRGASTPIFTSLRFGNPAYAQLGAGTAAEVLTASDQNDAPGAFATTLETTRLHNLQTKLAEFMPVGLIPVLIAET
jgi:hypothetical protein